MRKLPQVNVDILNCSQLFLSDTDDTDVYIAEDYHLQNQKVITPDENYIKMATDCDKFIADRRYITEPLSLEEEDFSIAFSIAMHQHVEQAERLLLAIYRPSNFYCIHVDRKSPKEVYEGMEAVAKCFDNVFMASRRVDVHLGTYSVLEADLVCMEDLLKRSNRWRYYINLTGKDFPLKTNLEMVRILKAYNGANDVERVALTR